MTQGSSELSTLDDLRGYVERTICDRKQLLRGAFQFDERVLVRHGQPCGLHFTLSGPRAVRYSAIWDVARHTILFYDCNGERFCRCDFAVTGGLREELAGLAGVNEKLVA